MKKGMLFTLVLLAVAFAGFAQEVTPIQEVETLIKTVFSPYFSSLAAVFGVTPIVTAFITKAAKTTGFASQAISWAVAIALAFVGKFLGLGIYEDVTYVQTALYGLAAGFASNGLYDIELVKALFSYIGAPEK